MNHYLYVRIGSTGALERFPNIEAVAAYLNTLKVGRPTRWYGHGFDTQNYHGSENISVFWGDSRGQYRNSIGRGARLYLESELQEANPN